MDGFRDGSGLFGLAGCSEAAEWVTSGLMALQHRGGSGGSIAASDGTVVRAHRLSVPVSPEARRLPGHQAIGQVTGGLGHPDFAGLPLDGGDRMVLGHTTRGPMVAALSGRFTNGSRLRRELKQKGALFQTDSDAEVVLHLIAQSSQRTLVNQLIDALWKVEGAFSLLLMEPEAIIAVRDPRGFRPLVLGRLQGGLAIASENTALLELHAEVVREVEPGEMIVVQGQDVQSVRPFGTQPMSRCVQEIVGLARNDAEIAGLSPYERRTELGKRLGVEAPSLQANAVLALPEDEPYAIGFARATGVSYERALLPQGPDIADWRAVPTVIRGRRIVLVSRSLLTGGPVRAAVRRIREAGALDVHVRIATPPIIRACLYGVPSPTTDELASARRREPEDLAAWLEADSVGFLSESALHEVVGTEGWCTGCTSGRLPIDPEEPDDQLPLF